MLNSFTKLLCCLVIASVYFDYLSFQNWSVLYFFLSSAKTHCNFCNLFLLADQSLQNHYNFNQLCIVSQWYILDELLFFFENYVEQQSLYAWIIIICISSSASPSGITKITTVFSDILFENVLYSVCIPILHEWCILFGLNAWSFEGLI